MDYVMTAKPAESSLLPEGVSIQPRKLNLGSFSKVPKYWFANNPITSHEDNVFSLFIPRGERFFIKSVRRYEKQIDDPQLRDLIRAFIQQEVNHYKTHDEYNASLSEKGINVERELAIIDELFTDLENRLSPRLQLGMTAFLEHLTAIGAKMFLSIPAWSEKIDPTMHQLWQWHAIEEIEHKAVAFDVFKTVSNSYFFRIYSAIYSMLVLGPHFRRAFIRVVTEDGHRNNKAAWRERSQLLTTDNAHKKIIKNFLMYFKPGFHPWKINDRKLLEKWYAENKPIDAHA